MNYKKISYGCSFSKKSLKVSTVGKRIFFQQTVKYLQD